MDMARKFLQMGYTRARRYANHRGGKKYDGPVPASQRGRSGAHGRAELPRRPAGESVEQRDKAEAAALFKACWDEARANLTEAIEGFLESASPGEINARLNTERYVESVEVQVA